MLLGTKNRIIRSMIDARSASDRIVLSRQLWLVALRARRELTLTNRQVEIGLVSGLDLNLPSATSLTSAT